MNDEVLGKSGGGPKACTTCAKAKSRCNPGPTEGICERPFAGWHDRPWSIDDCRDRCHRLKKPCSAQLPAPPRKRKAPKPTRVAELEKRLEELTARVESRQPQPPHSVDGESIFEVESPARKIRRTSFPDTRLARQQPGYTHIFASDNAEFHDQQRKQYLLRQKQNATKHRAKDIDTDSTAARLTAIATDSAEDGDRMTSRLPALQTHLAPRMADSTSSSSVTASNTSVIGTPPQLRAWSDRGTSEVKDPWYYPSSDEACQILVDFHSHFMPLFPFVVLPTDMGHEELRRDRPLLWKAILMQGLYFSAGRQVAMGDELLNTIIATAFLESKKSLDLLQALEILIAWFYMSSKSFQLTNLLFLSRSICVSLGFNESQAFSKQQDHTVTDLEQMRAFTGVYYLVTMLFTTNKKPDALMNTNYLDHCCRILEAKMEYSTDQLLVLLVRTQHLSRSVSMTLAFRNSKDSLPLSIVIQSFQHEIRQLRQTIPEDLVDCSTLKTQLFIAEILLYETGLSEDLSAGLTPTERLELLWECLNATRSMLEARFEKKKFEGRPQETHLASFDYIYAMLVCLKLSLLQLPGWDLRLVRKELNFDEYLMMQIANLQDFTDRRSKTDTSITGCVLVDGVSKRPNFQDPFQHLHTRLSQLRVSLLAELSASLPQDPQQSNGDSKASHDASLADGDAAAPDPSTVPNFGETLSDEAIQGLEDSFWQDWYKSNEWETGFSAVLGWGSDEISGPTYNK